MMRRHAIFPTVIAVLFALFRADAAPYAGCLYPCGIRRGETIRVLVIGQQLGGITGAFISGGGVRVLKAFNVPGIPYYDARANWLRQWIKNIEQGKKEPPPKPEESDLWRPNEFLEQLDRRDALEFSIISRKLHERPNPLQQNPSLSQMAILDIAADPDAEPGERELRIVCRSGISAPKLFYVDASPHVPEPLYTRPGAKKPPVPRVETLPAVLDGQIMPGETDSFRIVLQAGKHYTFALTGWKLLPYIGDAVPGHFQPVMRLLRPDGREAAFADDEYFLPDPVMRFRCDRSGEYTLTIRDNLFRGRQDFVYRVTLREGTEPYRMSGRSFPDADELPEEAYQERILYVGRPVVLSGTVAAGGRKTYRFRGEKGMKFSADLAARRDGSPLDGVLVLTDASGKEIARADDSPHRLNIGPIPQQTDPELSVELPADGIYFITVSDLNDRGGADYCYRLRLGPEEPDFTVCSYASMVSAHPGQGAAVKLVIERRRGFDAPIRIIGDKDLLPAPRIIPPKAETYMLPLRNPGKPGTPPREFELRAEAEVNGRIIRRRVIPADVFNQAFAYDHFLPARHFCLATRSDGKPRPKPAAKPDAKKDVKPGAKPDAGKVAKPGAKPKP